MAKKFPVRNALIAEHVLRGDGNKWTIINSYTGDVIVDKFPVTVSLGFYIDHLVENDGPLEITLELMQDDVIVGALRGGHNNMKKGVPNVLALSMATLEVPAPTVFSIVVRAEGYARTVAVKKMIRGFEDGEVRPQAAK